MRCVQKRIEDVIMVARVLRWRGAAKEGGFVCVCVCVKWQTAWDVWSRGGFVLRSLATV